MKAFRVLLRGLLIPALVCLVFAFPARGFELADLFTETSQPSGDFLTVLTQIRDLLNTSGAAQNASRCSESLMAEARLAVPRSLSSGVSTADPTTDNEYFTRDIGAGGLTGNQCAVTFSVMWMKSAKGRGTGNAGMARVTINMTCPCKAGPGALKRGSLTFAVPVNTTKAPGGAISYSIGPATNFVVEAECCNGRQEPKSYVDINGALVGAILPPVVTKPPTGAQPPRTPTQPYTSPPQTPPPKPPAPPVKAAPVYSAENPCPECENWRTHYLKARAAAEAAGKTIDEVARQIWDNLGRQEQAKLRIEQLTRELGRREGTGGQARDPDTGHTIDSWQQADGSVKITERDAQGNVIREETRQPRSSQKIREDIAKEQARLKELEAQHAQLQKELDYATKLKAKHEKHAAALLDGLLQCIEEKCKPIAQVTPISCVFPSSQAITLGPKEKFGPESAVSSMATGLMSSALGGLLGGGGGGGGGSGPDLKTDPVKDKQTFTDPVTGTKVEVGSIIRDGRLLTSVNVADAKEGEPVVHQIYRQQLVPQVPPAKDAPAAAGHKPCKVVAQEPIGWEPYGIYEAWWSKLRIQVWTSSDGGPWVKTRDTGWMDWGSGVNQVGGDVMTAEDIPKTAWGSMGASRPVGAPRSAGAVFEWKGRYEAPYLDKPAPERMVLHLAQPWKDPVTTSTIDLYPTYSRGGTVQYTDKMPDFKWDYKPKPGGGMQRIDPPAAATGGAGGVDGPAESILDSFEYMTQPM